MQEKETIHLIHGNIWIANLFYRPERKRLEGTDSVIEEKNKIARVSKKVQKEMNLERLATSKSAKSRREDESQTTMVVYPSTSQHVKFLY